MLTSPFSLYPHNALHVGYWDAAGAATAGGAGFARLANGVGTEFAVFTGASMLILDSLSRKADASDRERQFREMRNSTFCSI